MPLAPLPPLGCKHPANRSASAHSVTDVEAPTRWLTGTPHWRAVQVAHMEGQQGGGGGAAGAKLPCGVVYCLSRDECEQVSRWGAIECVKAWGHKAGMCRSAGAGGKAIAWLGCVH